MKNRKKIDEKTANDDIEVQASVLVNGNGNADNPPTHYAPTIIETQELTAGVALPSNCTEHALENPGPSLLVENSAVGNHDQTGTACTSFGPNEYDLPCCIHI